MCAEYQVNKQPLEIREWLKRHGESDSENNYRPRIKLYTTAPVIVGEEFNIQSMRFSLKPPGTPFATFNARIFDHDERADKIVSIAEKRTWKKPFAESRCLIPMTSFIEPIYTGTHAGEMVEFEDKILDMVFAAGVYEVSKDLKTGAPYTGFSIIMDRADPFVKQTGHHRTPAFLKQSSFEEWLSPDLNPDEAINLLQREKQPLDLKVKTDRKMAKGWEKRIGKNIEDGTWEEEFESLMKDRSMSERL